MLRDLRTVENGHIFPVFAKNGGKSLYFYSKEDAAIALFFFKMYDVIEPAICRY